MDDLQQLWDLWHNGTVDGLRRRLAAYVRRTFPFASRASEFADDVVSETFDSAVRVLSEGGVIRRVDAWFYKTARLIAFKRIKEAEQVAGHGLGQQSEDGDAGVTRWLEAQRVAEIQVESDQTPAFGTTDFDEPVIAGRRQSFLYHRGDVMSSRPQDTRSPVAEVLIELDLQADVSRGTST